MAYKYESAQDWLQDYLTRNPAQAHSVAMTLAAKLDADSIQDEFQSDMDADGYFDDESLESPCAGCGKSPQNCTCEVPDET